MSAPELDATEGVPEREPGWAGRLSAVFGRRVVRLLIYLTVAFLIVPVGLTLAGSFFSQWTGILPSPPLTLDNWKQALGLVDTLGATRGLGGSWTFVMPDVLFVLNLPLLGSIPLELPVDLRIPTPIPMTLGFSMFLALGGVAINLVVGVPIAYAVTRYDFFGRDWLNTIAVLPIVPGIILGIAFLRTYPNLPSSVGLVIGYSLLKAPYMVLAVQSSFESMDLRRMEESARSLGASWLRTFVTVIVPNAKRGIIAGSIVCWTLAAAEFNFSYIVYSRGPKPFSLFLYENISNNPFLRAAAAISIYFIIVVLVTALLRSIGERGFAYGGAQ